jgi:DNA-binding MarR family transcriptional regulator
VDLTEAGRTLAAQGLERVEAADIAYFSALGSDGTRQLARLLAKLSAGSAGLTQPAA